METLFEDTHKRNLFKHSESVYWGMFRLSLLTGGKAVT